MLIGNYQTKTSIKGRVALPAKFKKVLGKNIIITVGYEKSLMIVDQSNWKKLVSDLTNTKLTLEPARATDRFFLGNAFEIELDAQGRFIIPQSLRKHASVKEKVIFMGVGNRVELWSLDKWEEYQQYLDKDIEKIGQKLSNYTDGNNS